MTLSLRLLAVDNTRGTTGIERGTRQSKARAGIAEVENELQIIFYKTP